MQHVRVLLLGLDEIHQRIRQRPIVPDAPCQHVWHVPFDQVVHDAGAQVSLLHCAAQAADPANHVDGPHVVLVPLVDGDPDVQIHPERGAEEGMLDVVHGEGVSRQEPVDPTLPDESAQIAAAAAVHHHRPRHDDDASTLRLDLPHHADDPGHADLHPPLGRDVTGHEREPEPVAFLELGQDPDAVHPADHAVPAADVAELAADRPAVAHRHHRIHPLVLHVHPAPAVANLGPVIGGRVEVVGDEAVTGRGQSHLSLRPGMAPQGDQLFDQLAEPVPGIRRHPQLELRELLVGAADGELEHVEAGAAFDDLVEDRAEQPRVDEVALRLDDLAERFRGAVSVIHGDALRNAPAGRSARP